jgi:predicted enzyme related to lactoylglutathione lyase
MVTISGFDRCKEIIMKRIYVILLSLILFGISMSSCAAPGLMPPLPALNDPATDVRIPGKFIWADYFTSDVDTAKAFYAALFGWEWRDISIAPKDRYGIFYYDGKPVSGMAYRASPDPKRAYGRWVYYVSVDDVARTVQKIESLGGSTLLPARTYADRGTFAVVADPESAPFGVMHSSSGDPPDYQADLGDWLWAGLYANDAVAATKFYQAVFGYELVAPAPDYDMVGYVLSKQGYARAGVTQLAPNSGDHPNWVAYVRVSDVAEITETAVRLGATTLVAPDSAVLNGDLAIVADPIGAPIGFIHWVFPEDPAASGTQEVQQ